MGDYLISIIVPVYNVEAYLDECIESIVNQTHRNLEIILVDDGSPDNCPQMCDDWAKKDSRIRVIHKKNGGQSSARNVGLNVARGEYIGFVDSDDYISQKMYEVLLNAISETDKRIAACSLHCVSGHQKVAFDDPMHAVHSYDLEQSLNEVFERSIGTSVCSKLYHKSIFSNIRFPEGEVNEEYSLIIPTFAKSRGVVVVSDVLYIYRRREGSTTSTVALTESRAGIVYKNLQRMEKQLEEYDINCTKSFRLFSAQQAYYCAISMEKKYKSLSKSIKSDYKAYKRIMWKYFACFLTSKRILAKDKVLYVLVLTKLLRPALLLNRTGC